MMKRQNVTITSAMGEEKYALTPAQLLRPTDFATQLQMEQEDKPTAKPKGAAKPGKRAESIIDPAAERARRLAEGPYTGFLLVQCAECGEVSGYSAKRETYSSKCKKCGAETPLENLRMAFLECACGKSYRYKTNIEADGFSHPCLSCGKPIKVSLNWRRTAYVTEGGSKPVVPACVEQSHIESLPMRGGRQEGVIEK